VPELTRVQQREGSQRRRFFIVGFREPRGVPYFA
jgi:hypothetical protein